MKKHLSLIAFRVALVAVAAYVTGEAVADTPDNRHNVELTTFPVVASQAVAVDKSYFYAISNTRIEKYDKETGELIETWTANKKEVSQKHFKHLNSGTVVEGKLYGAHSRFPLAPNDCSVEIFDVVGETMRHVQSIRMPARHGSLTWIDRHKDGSWWMCYAVYGKTKNQQTKLIKYRYEDGQFSEQAGYSFPAKVIANWGSMSCSGGSWGPDGLLYTTGHDHAQTDVLDIDAEGELKYLRTEKNMGFYGQGIAWDRFAKEPVLWGIVKNKKVCATRVAATK